MPRVSKRDKIRNMFLKGQGEQINFPLENRVNKVYITAGYSRLSRLNNGNDNGDTIENQRQCINTYVKGRNDMVFVDHFCDNGFTGSDFQRPQWRDLMKQVENKKIDCIIFKDLSRLGRNFLETSEYLEQVFPAMGVRVISILDHYDSNVPVRDDDGILIALKNLMNDMYIKDIRTKGKVVRERKMKEGEYTRAVAPYGYVRSEDKLNTLEIDYEAAHVVQLIFQWRKEEQLSAVAIAGRLNHMKIIPPKQYQHIKNLRKTKEDLNEMKWGAVTIRRMLSNKVYCGYLIQGKIKGRGGNIKLIEKDQWYVKENAHEAIIPLNDYEIVQNTFSMKHQDKGKGVKKEQIGNVFVGLLYCHNCKRRMLTKKKKQLSYGCRRQILEDMNECREIVISMKTLIEVVKELLIKQINCVLAENSLLNRLGKNEEFNRTVYEYKAMLKQLGLDRDRNIQKQNNLYEDYSSGLLDKEEYLCIKEQYVMKEQEIDMDLQDKTKALGTYRNIKKRIKKLIKNIEKLLFSPYLTKEDIQLFIRRIEVDKENRVYITFSFTDIINEVYEITGEKGTRLYE